MNECSLYLRVVLWSTMAQPFVGICTIIHARKVQILDTREPKSRLTSLIIIFETQLKPSLEICTRYPVSASMYLISIAGQDCLKNVCQKPVFFFQTSLYPAKPNWFARFYMMHGLPFIENFRESAFLISLMVIWGSWKGVSWIRNWTCHCSEIGAMPWMYYLKCSVLWITAVC